MAKKLKRAAAATLGSYISTASRSKIVRCETCSCDDATRKDITEFAKMRSNGKLALSWSRFYTEFLAPNGYRLTLSALMNHVRNCLGQRLPRASK